MAAPNGRLWLDPFIVGYSTGVAVATTFPEVAFKVSKHHALAVLTGTLEELTGWVGFEQRVADLQSSLDTRFLKGRDCGFGFVALFSGGTIDSNSLQKYVESAKTSMMTFPTIFTDTNNANVTLAYHFASTVLIEHDEANY